MKRCVVRWRARCGVALATLLSLALVAPARAQVDADQVVLDEDGAEPRRETPVQPPADHGSHRHEAAASDGESAHEDSGSSWRWLARAETAGYMDSDSVYVLSPAAALRGRNEASGWDLGASYLVDAVSAASVDIVSTASGKWDEVRHVGSFDVSHKGESLSTGVAASASIEPDYVSLTAGLSLSTELDEKHVTPRFGYSFTHDTSGLNHTSFSDYSFKILRHGFSVGAEFVMNRFTTLALLGDGIFDSGDQRKPYRFVPTFTPDAAQLGNGASIEQVNQLRLPGRMDERAPLTRQRFAFAARLAQRYSGSTLILKERVYADTWGTKASTTTLRFVVDAGSRFYFWPEVRVHTQGAVDFYQLAYTVTQGPDTQIVPEYRTGDRELGALLTGTGGLGFRWLLGPQKRPSTTALVLEGEVGQTNYHEALFIARRRSGFLTIQLETEL